MKVEIEEARMFAFLLHVIDNHRVFKEHPENVTGAYVCSQLTLAIAYLFNVNPRKIPHLIEEVLVESNESTNQTKLLLEKLISNEG